MATNRQKGVPTRNTKGSVGDTYIDLNTGKVYKCVFAYCSNGQNDYSWVVDENAKQEPVKREPVRVETPKPVVKSIEEPVEEETPVVEEESKPRPNYAKQYQKVNNE